MTKKQDKAVATEGEVIPPAEVVTPAVEPKTETSIVKTDSIQSLTSVMSTDDLRAAVAIQKEQRAILVEFVKDQLVDGTDYGKIHVAKNCPNKWSPQDCKVKGHWSKDCLFKPGQEKIFSLLGITSELGTDSETLAMLGNPIGTIAYICKMYKGDSFLGEGRGSCEVGGGLNRDSNSATKIAEKRARMDACLALGFSEFFTQDMDDPDYRNNMTDEAQPPVKQPEPPKPATPVLTAKSRAPREYVVKMFGAFKAEGFTDRDTVTAIMKLNGVDPAMMTMGDVKMLAEKITKKSYAVPASAMKGNQEPPMTPPDDVVYDDIQDMSPEEMDQALSQAMDNAGIDEPPVQEPATVIETPPAAPVKTDDELMAETTIDLVQSVFPGAKPLPIKSETTALLTESLKQEIMNKFLSLGIDGADKINRFTMLAYGSTDAPSTEKQWMDFDGYLSNVLDMDPSELDSLLS